VGLVLGSGLGALRAAVEVDVTVPYGEIDGLPAATAPGHAGNLLLGTCAGVRVALLEGRLHLYEGWSPEQVVTPVVLLRALGARHLVVTNAAGALAPDFRPGDVMLIEDHVNLTGANPLIGPNDDALGLRFPDLSRAYAPELRAAAREVAEGLGIPLQAGIYAGVTGPSLETSAERRYLRTIGADAVGMSTVLEVIAANHCGASVLGLSAITNMATGGADQEADTIEAVLANAARAGERMSELLLALLPRMGADAP
jgi:purine-nucleoside phosphorylase